ncbi:unnamed protein product, partial [Amoebophrya sp. A25]|eukprot:GSA25T00004513001.1
MWTRSASSSSTCVCQTRARAGWLSGDGGWFSTSCKSAGTARTRRTRISFLHNVLGCPRSYASTAAETHEESHDPEEDDRYRRYYTDRRVVDVQNGLRFGDEGDQQAAVAFSCTLANYGIERPGLRSITDYGDKG